MLPSMTTHCDKTDHEPTTSGASSLVLHWDNPERQFPRENCWDPAPLQLFFKGKLQPPYLEPVDGGYIQVGTSSRSWLSLVAKNQGRSSRSYAGQADMQGWRRPTSSFICFHASFGIPSWWVSLGLVPSLPQSSGVAKGIGCLCILAAGLSPLKEL